MLVLAVVMMVEELLSQLQVLVVGLKKEWEQPQGVQREFLWLFVMVQKMVME